MLSPNIIERPFRATNLSPLLKRKMTDCVGDNDLDIGKYKHSCGISVKAVEHSLGFIQVDGYSTPPPVVRDRFDEIPFGDMIFCGTLKSNIIFHHDFGLCENIGKVTRNIGTKTGYPKGLYCCPNAYFPPALELQVKVMNGEKI